MQRGFGGRGMRDRSGRADPIALSWDESHKTGPGSSTCYCRVQDRRTKAIEAHQEAHDEVCDMDVNDPIFSDWKIASQEDAKRLWAEMVKGIEAGEAFGVRVRKV
jgi:hypothetical protein